MLFGPGRLRQVVGGLGLLVRLLARRGGGADRALYRRYLAEHPVRKLHIGCGRHLLSGWLNADCVPWAAAVWRLDATRRFPIADATFDYVFSEHMIEHVPYAAGQRMLAECRRVLKAGGRLRISTPDLGFLVALYGPGRSALAADYIAWASRDHADAEPNPALVINNFMRGFGHRFIYDEPSLRAAMTAVGLVEITRCELQQSPDPALRNLEHEARLPPGFLRLETLTLEAVNPG